MASLNSCYPQWLLLMRLLSPMAPLTGCYPRWLLLPIQFFMGLPLDLSAMAYEPIRFMLTLDECSLAFFSSDSFCPPEGYVGTPFRSLMGLGVPPPLGDRWFLVSMSRWGFAGTSRG